MTSFAKADCADCMCFVCRLSPMAGYKKDGKTGPGSHSSFDLDVSGGNSRVFIMVPN